LCWVGGERKKAWGTGRKSIVGEPAQKKKTSPPINVVERIQCWGRCDRLRSLTKPLQSTALGGQAEGRGKKKERKITGSRLKGNYGCACLWRGEGRMEQRKVTVSEGTRGGSKRKKEGQGSCRGLARSKKKSPVKRKHGYILEEAKGKV